MTDPKRALIYTRISRDDSGEGQSNQRQEAACRALAQARGWEVVGVENDISISAYTGKDRPGWNRVLEAMRSGSVDLVLTWAIDRVTRSASEFMNIAKLCRDTGVAISTATGDVDLSTDMGKAIGTIMSVLAELEVERKASRQRLANQQRAAQGKPWSSGWRPFGYELDGTVIKAEATLVAKAADDVLAGASLRSVVREWQALGVTTPRSARGVDGWSHNGVRKILLNPRNAGLVTYKGEVIGKGNWEPILSPEVHALLTAKLTDPSRLTRKGSRGRQPSNLLTGIATCAVCGEGVSAGTGHKGKLIYQCSKYHVSTEREAADALVRRAMWGAIVTMRPGQLMPIPDRGLPDELWQRSNQLQDRMNTVAASFADGVITGEQLNTATESLKAQLANVQAEITEAGRHSIDPNRLRGQSASTFLEMNLSDQRAVLSRLAVIDLHPRGRGKRNVPIEHQVTVQVRVTRKPSRGRFLPPGCVGDVRATPTEELVVVIDERPGSKWARRVN